jgi:predicted flavoprotein YhiN
VPFCAIIALLHRNISPKITSLKMTITHTDVLIIGAGAAGLMCAASAGYRGRSVTVVDMGKKAGRKILISGGGRCNFINQNTIMHIK